MRSSKRRRRAYRKLRVETCESRQVMSSLSPIPTVGLHDAPLSPPPVDIHDTLLTDSTESLSAADDLMGLTEARNDFGLAGRGQTVVVIDTGIAYTHSALGGGFGAGYRVVGGYDFTGYGDTNPYDDGPQGSHGTHVAGIIGSDNPSHLGVAPEVDLVALRVFDGGSGSFNVIEQALQWVHSNLATFENPITAVNMSLGAEYNSSQTPNWAVLEDELAQLENDGVFISVSAGNSFTTYNAPGLSYPAVSQYVVPVASVDASGELSYFSQRHDRVIAACGRAIRSTIPDYVGDHNGVDDDYARYSGTSMAAPYVAGASVLLREAWEFAGVESVTQDQIYALMRNTADIIHDPVTNADYHRLNLDRAINAIMPADDYGGTLDTSHAWGTLDSSSVLTGSVGRLDDQDVFRFTASDTGPVTLIAQTTHYLAPEWQLLGSSLTATGDRFSFDVVAGLDYAVSLGTDAGIGHYTLGVSLNGDPLPEDPSTPSDPPVSEDPSIPTEGGLLWNRAVASVASAGTWFDVVAQRDGILTIDASFTHSLGDVDLELYDSEGYLVEYSGSVSDFERIDVAVSAGEQFRLLVYNFEEGTNPSVELGITNLVCQQGGTVTVVGTTGNDVILVQAGRSPRVVINGIDYEFNTQEVHSILVNGGQGNDLTVVVGTSGNEQAWTGPTSARMLGDGFQVQVAGVEQIQMGGGGGYDRITMYDSSGNDSFLGRLTGTSVMRGDGFVHSATGFEFVQGTANQGGGDLVRLVGSTGNDVLVHTQSGTKFRGAGATIVAVGFERVASGSSGGYDRAVLRDTTLNDYFRARRNRARFINAQATLTINGYERVVLRGGLGGTDRVSVRAVDFVLRGLSHWRRY